MGVKHRYSGMPSLPHLPTGPRLPTLPKHQTLHQMFRSTRRVDNRPLIVKLMETKLMNAPVTELDIYDAIGRRYQRGVIGAMRSQGNRKEDSH